MDQIGWTVIETQFDPSQLHHSETVFTLGNGYLGTRGTFEEDYEGATPATFIHGVYDDVAVMHTELVNCPDWLSLVIVVAGERFRLDEGKVLDYQGQLDLRWGLLSRDVLWRSPLGNTVHLHFERMLSMADEHVLVLRCQVTPVDFSGAIAVEASLNGYPDNHGVRHWEWLNQGDDAARVWLHLRCGSGIELGMATQLTCSEKDAAVRATGRERGNPTLTTKFLAQLGQTVTLEKVVSVFTSRDVSAPGVAALERLLSLPKYPMLLAAHGAVWDELWRDCDVLISGDPTAQLAVRYNLFQLLAAAPRHDDRVSIPAKTLSGFAYRGHDYNPSHSAILELKLNLTSKRLQHWADIVRHILVLHDPETGMIEQFEGFFDLEDVNWAEYSERTQSMQAKYLSRFNYTQNWYNRSGEPRSVSIKV